MNIVAKTSYRIFSLNCGMLVEPKDIFSESYIFDHYSGYPNKEDADQAIVDYCTEKKVTHSFVVLCFVEGEYDDHK